MRKYQQKQLLEIAETMREALEAMLYADAQDCAIVMAESIDKTEGEGTKTAKLLIDYCEKLFLASKNELSKADLIKALNAVTESIRTELTPNKIEVVVLSYKAAMSDSVLGIYEAAYADEACDAYFIPIPYYTKDSNGDVVMICEGQDFYPSHIQCTNWLSYDIPSRHPDVIITNAPYDGTNYNYFVHTRFFCKNLRDVTDCLVYVPYFVAMNDDVPEHFCDIPGVLYAHKVIVQSEKVRDTYVRVLTHEVKRYAVAGSMFKDDPTMSETSKLVKVSNLMINDKIIALGSPKYDAVMNAKRSDFTLPKEWEALIGDKPVILYLTSVVASLQDTKQYVKKLRSVLKYFSERRDVALWWRPHPYTMEVFRNQRPKFLSEYEEIVERYKSEGWGIYDDSKELHRAIAVSDAYYGDASSVVALYQVTGKPIMIQNLTILSTLPDDFDKRLRARKLTVTEKNIFITDLLTAGVFIIDKVSLSITCSLCDFDFEQRYFNFANAVLAGNEIVFIPFYNNTLIVYDIKSQMTRSIDLGFGTSFYQFGKYTKGFLHNGSIWFVPLGVCDVLRYDISSRQIEHVSVGGKESAYVDGFIKENKLYLAGLTDNIIAVLDLVNRDFKKITLTDSDAGFFSICLDDDDNLWLTHNSKPELFCFKDGNSKKYTFGETGKFICKTYGKFVYLFSVSFEKVIKLDIISKEQEDITSLFEDKPFAAYSNYFSDVSADTSDNSILWLTNNFRGTLYKFDIRNEHVTKIKLFVPDIISDSYKTARKDIFSEAPHGNAPDEFTLHEVWGLQDMCGFVDALKSRTEFTVAKYMRENNHEKEYGDNGKKIYDYVKSKVLVG